jgi:hypothetical protein
MTDAPPLAAATRNARAAARDMRLAQALRENLRRRKAQAQARAAAGADAAEQAPPETPSGAPLGPAAEGDHAGLSGAEVSHKSNRSD